MVELSLISFHLFLQNHINMNSSVCMWMHACMHLVKGGEEGLTFIKHYMPDTLPVLFIFISGKTTETISENVFEARYENFQQHYKQFCWKKEPSSWGIQDWLKSGFRFNFKFSAKDMTFNFFSKKCFWQPVKQIQLTWECKLS